MRAKRLLISVLFCTIAVMSVVAQTDQIDPVHPTFTMTQRDGSIVRLKTYAGHRSCYIFYTTSDGAVVVKDANGDFCYARAEGGALVSTGVVAHEVGERTVEEQQAADISLTVDEAFAALAETVATRDCINRVRKPDMSLLYRDNTTGMGVYGETGGGAVNSIGEYTLPVVLVEFADKKMLSTNTNAAFLRQFNEEGYSLNGRVGSIRDYFISQSGGMFKPTFEIVDRITLDSVKAYYGKDEGSRRDVNLYNFIQEVLKALNGKMRKYHDTRTNNSVPNLAIIFAGTGQAQSGVADDPWPCEMNLGRDWSYSIGLDYGVNSVFIGNETEGAGLMSLGTFCHEFGHALGLPDLYCTSGETVPKAMYYWSVMDLGCYLNRGIVPMGYTAYEKNVLGWLDIPELTKPHVITLYPPGSKKGNNAVCIVNDADASERFILENRHPGTWYPADFGKGLLITHLHYDHSTWYLNAMNNDGDHLRYQVVAADGTISNEENDLWGRNGKIMFTDVSKPAPNVYSGEKLGKPVFKISVKTDSTITFAYLMSNPPEYYVGDTVEVKESGLTCRTENNHGLLVLPKGKYEHYSGDIVIPGDTVNFDRENYVYIGIDSAAFRDCPDLLSVAIGKNIRRIGKGAFRNSPKLAVVSVEEGNEWYEEEAGAVLTKKVIAQPAGTITSAEVDFAANPWGLPISENIADHETGRITETIAENGISVEFVDDTLSTYLYSQASGSVRLHPGVGSHMRVSANGNVITRIEISGTTVAASPNVGTLQSKVWTGEAKIVDFEITGRNTWSKIAVETRSEGNTWRRLVYVPQAGTGEFFLPSDVALIDDYAMEGAGYTNVTLPEGILSLGHNALSMPRLTSLESRSEQPAICYGGDPFTDIPATCMLHIPAGTSSVYSVAEYWTRFFPNVVEDAETGISAIEKARGIEKEVYDLQGRRVKKMQKGVYIINGAKIIR